MYALVALLIISSTASGSVTPRIVGGQDSEDHKYPYQVLILINNYPSCGGSIIHRRFILTAAHCIYKEIASKITIVAGTSNLLRRYANYKADMLIWNSNYNSTSYNDDIGLIRTKKNITFDTYVQPITLGSKYNITANETGMVTGWGRLSVNNSDIPYQLQELNVTIIEQRICQNIYWRLTTNNICTYVKVNKGLCMGDSGGPLVVKGEQVGIVSYGLACAIGFPDVYTRVFSYRQWIDNVTQTQGAGSRVDTSTRTILLLAVSVVLTCL